MDSSPHSRSHDSLAVAAEHGQGEKNQNHVWRSPLVTRAPFIMVDELCERLAFYGIASNIVVYMTHVLNLHNAHAAALVNIWAGTCFVTPLLGAFLADSYWGRFWTILCFSLTYMLGLLGLVLSAAIPTMTPPPGQVADSGQLALFWTSMYLIALGTGGIKPCVCCFGADQFDQDDPYQRSLLPRYFNWFFFCVNIGAVLASTVVVNVQKNVSWAAGFSIPLGAFLLAVVVFLSGHKLYRRAPPAGSPLTRAFRVLGGAVAHRKAKVPDSSSKLFEVEGDMSAVPGQPKMERTGSFRWLERAAVEVGVPGTRDRWLVTLTEVEEMKCVLRLLPFCVVLAIYFAVHVQVHTLFILQGSTMDRSLGSVTVAAATVGVLDPLSTLLWVAMYDLVLQPWFTKAGRPITVLQRMGAGMCVSVGTMLVAGGLEVARLGVVHSHGLTDTDPTLVPVPLSVWWQVPQYFMMGMSDALTNVATIELFYSQAPDSMRSTCFALQLITQAAGNYLAAGLVGIVQAASGGTWIAANLNQAHMDYFFFLLAGLQVAGFLVFLLLARRFSYRRHHRAGVDVAALGLACSTSCRGTFSRTFSNLIKE